MMPPGLAFLSVSDKAWKAIDKNPNPRTFYFDLKKARKKLETGDTPFTPAHTLIRAMRVSLKKIRAEGIENILARQARNAAAARAAFVAMGLKIFPAPPNTAPDRRQDAGGDRQQCAADQAGEAVRLETRQRTGQLKGKIIRLAHMGYIDQFDVLAAISGIELVLRRWGMRVVPGVAWRRRSGCGRIPRQNDDNGSGLKEISNDNLASG